MFTDLLVYALTVAAVVIVVLTRLRLAGRYDIAGRLQISEHLLTAHTVAGGLASVLWILFLLLSEDAFLGGPAAGIVAIGLFWVAAIAGLLILARWLPARGRHAHGAVADTWSEGPGLSLLAHLGMVVCVLVFTYAYLTSAV